MLRTIITSLALAALVGVFSGQAEARHRQPVRNGVRATAGLFGRIVQLVLPPYGEKAPEGECGQR